MARSTAPGEASGALVRHGNAVILRRPYRTPEVSRRTPSSPVRHAAERTASSTKTSLIVRAAMRPCAPRHAR
jgi:hypothetical protein